MDIKAIINLMAFEIKAQLKTKAFWLLAILPPLALIAMFWLNTTNTVSNNIYVINTTNIPINIEPTEHLIIKKVGSDFQCSKKDSPDAVITISNNGEGHIMCSIDQYRIVLPENLTYIQKNIRDSYTHHILSDDYFFAIKQSVSNVHFETEIKNVESNYLTVIATAIIIILYIVILQFSSSILRMIGKEKKNKISEVLLTALNERDIIISKLLSGLIVATVQILFWLVGAIIIAYIIDIFAKTSIWDDIISTLLSLTNFVSVHTLVSYLLLSIVMFIGGYLLYASIFSIIGAISSENTNTQQFSIIATLPLLLTFIYISKNINTSNSVIDFLSIFPLSSPIALLASVPQEWSWPVIICSVATLYLCDIILIYITSKLYKDNDIRFLLRNNK
ncbi:ABC transporter permease [Muribaculum intestinale]|uniref:ABC transporter permease n=1 Tax=Muribaculum intestinale TaxID=1796646 RepID=UPI003F67270C